MAYRILMCGDEPQLLETREMVLSRAGYAISSCTTDQLETVLEDVEIDLFVVGHSLTLDEQNAVTSKIGLRWNSAAILYLTRTHDTLEQISTREFQCGAHNPSRLIANCQHILDGRVQNMQIAGSTLTSA